MSANNAFSINQIDSSTVQIFGMVNGFACKRPWPGEMAGSYSFSIRFFDAKKRLITVSNSEKDGTIRSVDRLADRISGIYSKANQMRN